MKCLKDNNENYKSNITIRIEFSNKKSFIKKNFKTFKDHMKMNSDDFENKLSILKENLMISKRESMKKIKNVLSRMKSEKQKTIEGEDKRKILRRKDKN